MSDFANPALTLVRAGRRAVRWLRRLATRVLLVQVHAEMDELRRRQDRLERQLHTLLGRHYDNLAAAQRLAALEDHVRDLLSAGETNRDTPLPPKG